MLRRRGVEIALGIVRASSVTRPIVPIAVRSTAGGSTTYLAELQAATAARARMKAKCLVFMSGLLDRIGPRPGSSLDLVAGDASFSGGMGTGMPGNPYRTMMERRLAAGQEEGPLAVEQDVLLERHAEIRRPIPGRAR
ncbi:MAG: hypothetical protein MZU79_04555 [Anaerotruncus sp.]|nr:hypothetical protein [Anaerotruncus sp.]